ncbi:MAG: beta-phosphoglucomutase family hydrolase [Phototrophicaceae bacterium]
MTTPDIRGLIFDMDGVIANTDELHYRTWQQLADEEGVPFSREKYIYMSGVGHEENAKTFTEGLEIDDATIDNWMARKQQYYVALRDTIQPDDVMPGIPQLIDAAKATNLKIAVGSSSRNARPVLERLNLAHHFEIIGDGYTVKHLKPEPDIFLWVAGGLQLPPEQCLVLEDAPAGITAALRAGCYVIGVGERDLSDAHHQVVSLADTSLQNLLESLKS